MDEKFWNNTKPNGDCLEWQGHVMKNGYGQVKRKGKLWLTHRYAKGYSGDLDVCHNCHNRKCVNPEHLYVGTRQQNLSDRVKDETSDRRLEPSDILHLTILRDLGYLQREVGKILGVSQETISNIELGKIYTEWDFLNC